MVENNFENRFLKEIVDMAEDIVRRNHPFNNPEFKIDPELDQYINTQNDIDREKVIDSLVESVKFSIGGYRYADSEKMDYLDNIWYDIKKKKGYKTDESESCEKGINHKPILIRVMNDRKKGFVFDKKESRKGFLGFSKDWFSGVKQLICFDVGIKRDSIIIYIGLREPYFIKDVKSFFPRNLPGGFWYNNEKEFEEAVHKSLDLFDLIFPHFFKRAERVLSEINRD